MDRSRRCVFATLGTSAAILAAGCYVYQAPTPVMLAPPPPPVVAQPAPVPVAPPPPPGLAGIVIKDVGLQMPRSVLWDADQDVYFVSNINGDPVGQNKNGFLSKIGPDGKVIALKFIDGSKKGSELNAPKGLALVGEILYVADINVVRKFDRKSGKAKGVIKIAKSVFLNDLSASPDGKTLYVSDSAVTIQGGSFAGTGDDAIYAIDVKKNTAVALIRDPALHSPSGLLADEDGVWVVTLGANQLFHVDQQGGTGPATKLPKGGLDGIVKRDDGSFLISSWEASAIYGGKPGGEFKEVISDIPSAADIGFDSKRNTLLVPLLQRSAIQLVWLSPPAAAPAPQPPVPPATTAAPPPATYPAPTARPWPAPSPVPVYGPAPTPAAPPAPGPVPPDQAGRTPTWPAAPAAPPAPAPAPYAPAPAPAPYAPPYGGGYSAPAPPAAPAPPFAAPPAPPPAGWPVR